MARVVREPLRTSVKAGAREPGVHGSQRRTSFHYGRRCGTDSGRADGQVLGGVGPVSREGRMVETGMGEEGGGRWEGGERER